MMIYLTILWAMFKKWVNAILLSMIFIKHQIYTQIYQMIKNLGLNNINEIKDYFFAKIRERELMSKNFSKYTASFEYLDKSLIVLSAATGSISIASFGAIGAPVGIVSASCSLTFSVTTGFVKKFVKTTRNKKKKTQ